MKSLAQVVNFELLSFTSLSSELLPNLRFKVSRFGAGYFKRNGLARAFTLLSSRAHISNGDRCLRFDINDLSNLVDIPRGFKVTHVGAVSFFTDLGRLV